MITCCIIKRHVRSTTILQGKQWQRMSCARRKNVIHDIDTYQICIFIRSMCQNHKHLLFLVGVFRKGLKPFSLCFYTLTLYSYITLTLYSYITLTLYSYITLKLYYINMLTCTYQQHSTALINSMLTNCS